MLVPAVFVDQALCKFSLSSCPVPDMSRPYDVQLTDEQRRYFKRTFAIETVKKTECYKVMCQNRAAMKPDPCQGPEAEHQDLYPGTPRSPQRMRKREWESKFRKWKLAVKAFERKETSGSEGEGETTSLSRRPFEIYDRLPRCLTLDSMFGHLKHRFVRTE